jgi:hypothetical protein
VPSEIAAQEKLLARNQMFSRWREMSKWGEYRGQQRDPARFRKAAARRAIFFAAMSLVTLFWLLLRA